MSMVAGRNTWSVLDYLWTPGTATGAGGFSSKYIYEFDIWFTQS